MEVPGDGKVRAYPIAGHFGCALRDDFGDDSRGAAAAPPFPTSDAMLVRE